MSLFRDLFWFFKQERKSYGTGIFVLVVVALLNLIPPYLVRITVDRIENKSLTPGTVLMLIAQLIAVGLLVYALRYAWRILIFGSAVRLGKLMRSRLYTQFTLMSPGFFHTHNTGDLMAHATNDVQAIEMTAGEGVLTFADSLITGSLVVISMALFISWKLTIIALLPMPLMAWLTSYYGTLLHRYFHQAQAAFSELNDKVQENIAGVRVIKAFGQEEAERSAFRELSAEVVAKNVAVAKVDALFDPTIMLIVGISFFLSVAFGSIDVIRGRLSLGQLTQFTIYLGQFIWPMLAFGWLFNIIERGRASYDRVSALLAVQPEIREREDALQQIPSGSVEVNLKCFCFPGSTISALQDISFSLRCGQTLGIVGRTGSGKTTLLRLLLREFDLKSGNILIGGWTASKAETRSYEARPRSIILNSQP
ncbi:MAG TPA: ABC transporter transmembrane domain-containing protein, partial [Desulfobacteria bacterium]|nr:ABC transporter transmembrane domain-containing protein [Desulfobacteria bacterium]